MAGHNDDDDDISPYARTDDVIKPPRAAAISLYATVNEPVASSTDNDEVREGS